MLLNLLKSNQMKKIFTILMLAISLTSFSQTPGIFFQAVAKDASGNPFPSAKIYIQSSILQYSETGTAIFVEKHDATTDADGVFNITLGHGVKTAGSATSLMDVDWGHGPFYLGLKMSTNGTTWTDMGATPFGAVPYALFAGSTAQNGKLSISDSITLYVTPSQLRGALGSITFDTTSLSNRINSKLNISDTTNMLKSYVKTAYVDNALTLINTAITNSGINNYVLSDSLRTALRGKLNIIDTASMLEPYARKSYVDAGLATKLSASDTISLSSRIDSKISLSDTLRIFARMDDKLNVSDTSAMLSNRIGRDTVSLSNRINLKANIASPTFTGTVTASGDVVAKRYRNGELIIIPAIATTVVDLSLGNVFQINLGTSITTLTLNNAVPGTYLIKISQVAGTKTVVFPSTWKWADRYTPAVTPTSGRLDIVTLVYDGTTFYATIVQNF
jgi:hypothetical protein